MSEEPPEDERRFPRQRPSLIDVGDWLRQMRSESTGNEELDELEPDTRQEVLFALGFVTRDISPDERHDAREQYMQEYGTETPHGYDLTRDQWRKWRQLMNYE